MEKISRNDLILCKGGSFLGFVTNLIINLVSLKTMISFFRWRKN